jgi:hypothetical protein
MRVGCDHLNGVGLPTPTCYLILAFGLLVKCFDPKRIGVAVLSKVGEKQQGDSRQILWQASHYLSQNHPNAPSSVSSRWRAALWSARLIEPPELLCPRRMDWIALFFRLNA